jgi:fatty acid desaturase
LSESEGTDSDAAEADPDDAARREALRFVLRRTAVWAAPLFLLGWLISALGIPWWLSALAMIATLAALVFELDI